MEWSFLFFLNNILLGVGLAMDAFSVSLANGLNEPRMRTGRMCKIAGVYAVFQAVMPLTGWLCVRTVAQLFTSFQELIPWIALALLVYIGGKMLTVSIDGDSMGKFPFHRLTEPLHQSMSLTLVLFIRHNGYCCR